MLTNYLPQNIVARLILTFVLAFAMAAGVARLLGVTSSPLVPAGATALAITLMEYFRFTKEKKTTR